MPDRTYLLRPPGKVRVTRHHHSAIMCMMVHPAIFALAVYAPEVQMFRARQRTHCFPGCRNPIGRGTSLAVRQVENAIQGAQSGTTAALQPAV